MEDNLTGLNSDFLIVYEARTPTHREPTNEKKFSKQKYGYLIHSLCHYCESDMSLDITFTDPVITISSEIKGLTLKIKIKNIGNCARHFSIKS